MTLSFFSFSLKFIFVWADLEFLWDKFLFLEGAMQYFAWNNISMTRTSGTTLTNLLFYSVLLIL